MNAMKHGFTARDVVLPGEDPDDFDSFRAELLSSLTPKGALEGALAEMIIADVWRLRRVPRFEALLYRYGGARLRVRQAEELVMQYESTEEERLLASLEKKSVAERDREAHEDAENNLARERAHINDPAFNVTRVLEMSPEPLGNLWRHESALTRSLVRNMHELERLQAKRAGQYVPLPEVVDVDVKVSQESRANFEGASPNRETQGNQK